MRFKWCGTITLFLGEDWKKERELTHDGKNIMISTQQPATLQLHQQQQQQLAIGLLIYCTFLLLFVWFCFLLLKPTLALIFSFFFLNFAVSHSFTLLSYWVASVVVLLCCCCCFCSRACGGGCFCWREKIHTMGLSNDWLVFLFLLHFCQIHKQKCNAFVLPTNPF